MTVFEIIAVSALVLLGLLALGGFLFLMALAKALSH